MYMTYDLIYTVFFHFLYNVWYRILVLEPTAAHALTFQGCNQVLGSAGKVGFYTRAAFQGFKSQ